MIYLAYFGVFLAGLLGVLLSFPGLVDVLDYILKNPKDFFKSLIIHLGIGVLVIGFMCYLIWSFHTVFP